MLAHVGNFRESVFRNFTQNIDHECNVKIWSINLHLFIILLLCEIGERMNGVSGDPRGTTFSFHRLSVIVQRANAIALRGSFVIEVSDD